MTKKLIKYGIIDIKTGNFLVDSFFDVASSANEYAQINESRNAAVIPILIKYEVGDAILVRGGVIGAVKKAFNVIRVGSPLRSVSPGTYIVGSTGTGPQNDKNEATPVDKPNI